MIFIIKHGVQYICELYIMLYLELSEKLEHFLMKKIHVMTCVAVIGSTEEGAIDPIHGLYGLRKQFRMRVK